MFNRRVFYLVSIFALLSSLLLILANNVPILLSYRWLWGPITLLLTALSFPNIFSQKNVRAALLYGFLYAGILQYTLWRYANDWYKKAIFEDFYGLVVFVVMFTILKKYYFQREWRNLAKLGLIFFIITGIMTIVATSINPMVVRASYSNLQFDMPEFNTLYKLGFGGYGYMIAVVALIPILVFFFKTDGKYWISKKIALLLIIFFFFVIIRSQIFANILIGIMSMVLSFLGAKTFKRNVIVIGLITVILLLIPNNFWFNSFMEISNIFSKDMLLNYKFRDLAYYIASPDLTNPNTGAAGRAARYPMLFEAFMANPFFGDASYRSKYIYEMGVGGHLYWMSRLTLWGIFGFCGYIILLKKIFHPVINIFDKEFRFYYMVSLLSIIILGLMKNLGGREPYIMLFIIIPGLYLSQNNFKE